MAVLVWSVILIVPMMWLSAHVTVDLWDWFVVPLGAPKIGLIHALGLSLLVHWKTAYVDWDKKSKPEHILYGFIFILTVWGVGTILARMMP